MRRDGSELTQLTHELGYDGGAFFVFDTTGRAYLAALEGGSDACCFASGMAAISTCLWSFLRPGDVVLHNGEAKTVAGVAVYRALGGGWQP